MKSIKNQENLASACMWLLLIAISATDAFSTISNSRIPASATSTSRSSSARGGGGSYASVGWSAPASENGHTNNYVTVVEDCNSYGGRGMFVATTDHNYVIQSPALHDEQGWQSVTVNGDQVFVLTSWNRTFSTSLNSLTESQRDFIAEARANFTQNLAGLRLAHYTSGSSTLLGSSTSGSANLGSSSSSGARPSVAELIIAQMVSGTNNQWGQFVSSNSETSPSPPHVPHPQEYPQMQGFGESSKQTAPPSSFQSSGGQQFLEENSLPSSAASFFASKRRTFSTTTNSQTDGTQQNATINKQPEVESSKKTRSLSQMRYPSGPQVPYVINRQPNYNYQQLPVATTTMTSTSGGYAYDPLTSKSLCSSGRWLDSFNYYNLNAGSPLNQSLAGDVYFFDFHCNTLDVYSSSVSVRQSLGMSAIYRDANYFSFSRSNLPSAINRMFLVDNFVFLIYNDGSLLVKANWMLDAYELDLIVQARNKLKLISAWQSRAAQLVGVSI